MPLFTRISPMFMRLALDQSGTDNALDQAFLVQKNLDLIQQGQEPEQGAQGLILQSIKALQQLIVAHHTYEKSCILFQQSSSQALVDLFEPMQAPNAFLKSSIHEYEEQYLKATKLCSYVMHFYVLQLNPTETLPLKPVPSTSPGVEFAQSIERIIQTLHPLCSPTLWDQAVLAGRSLAQIDILQKQIPQPFSTTRTTPKIL